MTHYATQVVNTWLTWLILSASPIGLTICYIGWKRARDEDAN